MIQNGLAWWQARDLREQRLLVGLAVVVLLLLAWFAVRALASAVAHEDMRVSRAVAVHEQVLAYAGESSGGDAPAAVSPERLLTLAQSDGLDVRVTGGTGSAVELAADAVKADILFNWIVRVEREERLKVMEADIRRNEDSTLSAAMTIGAI
jgi:type II secretory pathway component PulM|tara:strand:- start:535 stop:990 length:456 start_codon:yes stop_codon:yes gene_type:complete